MNSATQKERHALRLALPIARKIAASLSAGNSVIVSGPRYFGVESIAFAAIDRAIHHIGEKAIVRLAMREDSRSGDPDWSAIWDSAKVQLGSIKSKVCADRQALIEALSWCLARKPGRAVVFVLTGTQRAHTGAYLRLVEAVHEVVAMRRSSAQPNCLFVAADDFSLHYATQDSAGLRSELSQTDWVYFQHLDPPELRQWCQAAISGTPEVGDDHILQIVKMLTSLTDGHFGLIEELIAHLSPHEGGFFASLLAADEADLQRVVQKSTIIEKIRQVLGDDSMGLCETALEFRELETPTEYRSPRVQILKQLGILRWENSFEARLCRGGISEMIEAVGGQSKGARIGTIRNIVGTTAFRREEFSKSPDDIIVVHLSDMHFGDDYGFRLEYSGKVRNESQLEFQVLLETDLRGLGLLNKVDLLVVTGDIACTGVAEEYGRARAVLRDVMKRLSLKADRLLIVAGNHDLQWDAPDFSNADERRNVSRENFENFIELLTGREYAPSDAVAALSASGNYALRVVSLDSNEVEGRDAAGVGFVSEESFERARLNATGAADGVDTSEANVRTWAAVHHHVAAVTSTPITDARRKAVSVMANTPAVLAWANEIRAEVVLHGHEHQPAVSSLRWWLGDRGSKFGEILSIGAGSATAKRERLGPVARNHYMILIQTPNELIVRSRIMGEQALGFQGHEDLVLPCAPHSPASSSSPPVGAQPRKE